MLRNGPSINLEMDHPVLRSAPSRSPRPIERVDLKVLLREEDTAHAGYPLSSMRIPRDGGFFGRAIAPVRGDGVTRLFFGVTCVPAK